MVSLLPAEPPAPSLNRCRGSTLLTTTPTFDHLYRLFPDSPDRPIAVEVPADELPEPYHSLLVHTHHMTVTVEQFYGSPINVQVLNCRRAGNEYARKSLLTLRDHSQRVIQFGFVRIDLGVCSEAVRNAIVEGKTPLGRILIQHNMLRRIEPTAYLRVTLSATMAEWFGVAASAETYGRVGVIYTGAHPAVEVLEILAPVPGKQPA